MLLVQETIDKYGYDPNGLTNGSHKLVLFSCDKCGLIQENRLRYVQEFCKECKIQATIDKNYKPKVLGIKKLEILPQMMVQETFNKFGYYPEDLSYGSHRKVVWKCSECGNLSESVATKIKGLTKCFNCSQREKTVNNNKRAIDSGFAPSGLPLGQDKDKYRNTAKLWRRQWRSTDTGKAINRLRVGLKRISNGYSFKDLPYSPEELAEHIKSRLEFRNNKCPLCVEPKPFSETGYDIDHKTPLCKANSPEEALALFALSNLDVLCPYCNQFVKRDNEMEY